MKRVRTPALALLLLLLPLSGCQAWNSLFKGPTADYVQADAATYDAVAPAQEKYLNADGTLTPEQRERRLRTLATWKLRVEQNGGTVTTQPSQ